VVPQRPDQVVLPMHPYPQLVLPASPPCHPVVPAIQDRMVDLQDPDLCIQNGEVEDLGEVPATHLGQPPLRPVPWLGHQPRLALATRSKVHLDGVQDFRDLVHNLVVVQDPANMVDLLVDQDQDHMVHNTILDPDQTLGLDLKDLDQEQDHHTDRTR